MILAFFISQSDIMEVEKLIGEVMFIELNKEEKESLSDLKQDEFLFDWTRYSSENSITVACVYQGEVSGLVEFERQRLNHFNYLHLIEVAETYKGKGIAGKCLAYVAKDSLEHGFDGFVVFESKTVLFEYYIEKYGAKPISKSSRKLYFDTEASLKLIETYLEEGDV